MPNIKSSVRDVKTTAIRNAQNRSIKSDLKTAVKKFEGLLAENKSAEAADFFKSVASTIDKAVSKGVIHKNTAARQKSRLASNLSSAQA